MLSAEAAMEITGCVPLTGQGVIARQGDLVVVADDRGTDPGPLLAALAEAAAAADDGNALVRRVTRAVLDCQGAAHPAWACAGVTTAGAVTVLVHGHAVATVSVDGGQQVTLTAGGSVIPVNWTFTGATVTVGLAVGDRAVPDPRSWLGHGVVRGGGLAVTVSSGTAAPAAGEGGMSTPASPRIGPVTEPLPERNWREEAPDASPAGPSQGVPASPPEARADDPPGPEPEPVVVDGVRCSQGHFNDPAAANCRRCRVSLDQQLPRNYERGARPPLGELVLDDGRRFPLDRDYVLGREPRYDSDVVAGRAWPLLISDQDGTVSRMHLRVSLVDWRVEVTDLGTVNGSVLHADSGGDARKLAPFEPTQTEPGTRIGIGRRTAHYVPK
jgi:hypothetical protein